MINSILGSNGRKHNKTRDTNDYPLSGKMWCPECGQYYVGTCGTSKTGRVYHYYKCKKCRRTFRRDAVEEAVLDTVLETIKKPDVRQRIVDAMALYDEMNEEKEEPESKRIEREIKRIDAAFERIWQAIEDGIAPPGGKERVDMLREQKAALEADLRQAQASESAHLSGEDIAAWLDHIAQEPDAAEIIDTFVRLIEVDGEELKLYFAFDYWGDDFQPKQKKRRTPKSSSNNPMVEARRIELRSTKAP